MAIKDYRTEITSSSRTFTGKERVKMKDLSLAAGIDATVTPDQPFQLHVADWAVVHVENDRAKDGNSKAYDTLILIDNEGRKFNSGSPSLMESFLDIWEEMSGEDEDYDIIIYQRPSRNRPDKYFLTCSIA